VVQHKHTKTLYALKYINKAKCVKMKAVANIVQERRLLEEVSAVRWCRGDVMEGASIVVRRGGVDGGLDEGLWFGTTSRGRDQ
jgi:hypothetical protein